MGVGPFCLEGRRTLTLIGQTRGARDQAIAHCMDEIDAILAREHDAERR